jgi:hypothetical protein
MANKKILQPYEGIISPGTREEVVFEGDFKITTLIDINTGKVISISREKQTEEEYIKKHRKEVTPEMLKDPTKETPEERFTHRVVTRNPGPLQRKNLSELMRPLFGE